ncbi:MAG: hypothetical protein V3V25_04045 [Paracoccaceae bacterium]
MELARALAEFDGKLTAPLRDVVAVFDDRDGALLAELCHGTQAVAATWVVKALLEDDRAGALDLHRVFEALGAAPHWEARLHLLQSVQHAPEAAMAQGFAIRGLLAHPKILVRVWALDAFVRLALVDRGLLAEARELVSAALDDRAASLRARGRALQLVLDQSSA